MSPLRKHNNLEQAQKKGGGCEGRSNKDGESRCEKSEAAAMSFRWVAVPNPPGYKKTPLWKRSAAIDDQGDVWVPAVIAGSEKIVFLCAGYDGEPAVIESKHLFVRASWMAREFPETREVCEKITKRMREGFQG